MRSSLPDSIPNYCWCWLFFFSSFAALADQNDPQLDKLFERLHTFPNAQETERIEREIWKIWMTSEDEEVNQLMQEGIQAMRDQYYHRALRIFDNMVEIAPHFAEGWNKRATIHYLLQNYETSISDIERTLALEPRHFGAIAGLGLVHLAQQNYYEALRAYEAVLKIHPTLAGAKVNLAMIKQYLKKHTL